MAIVVFSFILLFALYMIFTPLFGRRVAWIEYDSDSDHWRRELEMQKNINLRALKDIEFERASGKMSREDYLDLKDHYQKKAAQVLSELEELDKEGTGGPEPHSQVYSGTKAHRKGYWDEEDWDDQLQELDRAETDLELHPSVQPTHDIDDEGDDWVEEDWEVEEDDMKKSSRRHVYAKSRNRIQHDAGSQRKIIFMSFVLVIIGAGLVTFEMGKKSGQTGQPQPVSMSRTDLASNQPLPVESLKIAGLKHAIDYLKVNPWNVQAHIHVGEYYLDEGDTDQALDHFLGAFEYEPESVRVLTPLGRTYRQMGEVDLAIENLQAALNTEPSALEPRYHLGLIFGYEKGNKEKAADYFQKILSSDPNEALRTEVSEELKKLGISDG